MKQREGIAVKKEEEELLEDELCRSKKYTNWSILLVFGAIPIGFLRNLLINKLGPNPLPKTTALIRLGTTIGTVCRDPTHPEASS